MLKLSPDAMHIKLIRVTLNEDNPVRITHINRNNTHRPGRSLKLDRRLNADLTHIDRDRLYPAIAPRMKPQMLDAAQCLKRQLELRSQVLIINKLANTAAPVATHPRFRTVSIKYTHLKIRLI